MPSIETESIRYQTAIDPDPYPGYPSIRLVMPTKESPNLPDGPWRASNDQPPTDVEKLRLLQLGLELDDFGRPIHPWLKDMLTNPSIGVVTGKGYYYDWGPNRTGDPIIITKESCPKILLVLRSDNGKWSLPGGFVDPNEDPKSAALREAREETGVIVNINEGEIIYSGPVADQRSTAHAWADTTAVLWRPANETTTTLSDESNAVNWFDLRNIRAMELHGSHQKLIEKAIIDKGTMNDIIEYFGPDSEVIRPSGGHMAYDRLIVRTPAGNVFVKKHDPSRFTDEMREQHSRQYLIKEKSMYDQLQQNGYRHIPSRAEIVNDHSLMLSAYLPDEGWHWRVPSNDYEYDLYVADILSALDDLAELPVLEFDEINDSLDSFVREGWQSLDEKSIDTIRSKLLDYASKAVSPTLAKAALELMDNLERLKLQSQTVDLEQPTVAAHNDFRQSNMAWHPDHGVRIVDWSWAGRSFVGADKTTFLIDMHKHGHDITNYVGHVNLDHTLLLIGFWLMHSLEPTCDRTGSVRFQQVHSAVAAFDLLQSSVDYSARKQPDDDHLPSSDRA